MNDERKTIWCGNLADKVTEELLYELFIQAAPLERVRIPTDKQGRKSNFGFVTVKHEVSVKYAIELLNGTYLYNRELNLKARVADQNPQPQHFQNPKSQVLQDNVLEQLTKLGQQLNHNYHPDQRGYSAHNDRRRDNYKPYHRHDNHHNRQGRNGQYGNKNRNNADRNKRQWY